MSVVEELPTNMEVASYIFNLIFGMWKFLKLVYLQVKYTLKVEYDSSFLNYDGQWRQCMKTIGVVYLQLTILLMMEYDCSFVLWLSAMTMEANVLFSIKVNIVGVS